MRRRNCQFRAAAIYRAYSNGVAGDPQMHIYSILPLDFDRDGDLDLFVTGPNDTSVHRGPEDNIDIIRFYRNDVTHSNRGLRVRVSEQGNSFGFATHVTQTLSVNLAPTDVALSSHSFYEHQPSATLVGNLSATDPNSGEVLLHSLVAGAGSGDNAAFTISGNQLRTNVVFDHATRSSYSVRIRTTDGGGLWREQAFTITVIDVTDFGVTRDSASTATLHTGHLQPGFTYLTHLRLPIRFPTADSWSIHQSMHPCEPVSLESIPDQVGLLPIDGSGVLGT